MERGVVRVAALFDEVFGGIMRDADLDELLVLLVVLTLLPVAFGFFGLIYAAAAVALPAVVSTLAEALRS
mgnify:CR=1 FL=1